MNFGERLLNLRKAKNLSQENLAESLNVTRQTVSKWETNQSTPDFDKIVPLAKILDISVEELVTGVKPNQDVENIVKEEKEKIPTKQEVREMSAKVVSTSIFIYIASLVFMIVTITILRFNPIISTSIFLLGIGWATVRIIRHYMSVPKFEKTDEEKEQNKIVKQINDTIKYICLCIYFIISFMTSQWHLTWIIFIVYGLLCQVTKLIFMLKEGEDNEK